MKIIGLWADNIKRLTAVEIAPEGAVVKITGRNKQGKTSVLDAIWWALEGAKHIQSAPIRKGAKEARIRLDLGELNVTRTFARRDDDQITTSLSVESPQGARFPSPQKVLDDLVGALSMDPLEFMRAEPKAQLAQLRSFVKDVDFGAIEKLNAADFTARADANRQGKALRAQAAGVIIPAGAPTERIDDLALIEALEQAGEHNTMIERRKAKREEAIREVQQFTLKYDGCIERAEALEAEAKRFRALAVEHDAKGMELQAKIDTAEPLPEPIDTVEVRRQIGDAKHTNALVDARQRRADIEGRAAAFEKQSEELTLAINGRLAEVQKVVEESAMPIPGLSFGDDEVLLNGLPLDQASDAEQLQTSIAITMALNPKLRVIRVRDGSLMDADALKLLTEMAEAQDYQVWIELVDESGAVGFVIEDGTVKSRPEKAAKREKANV
jgi:hypothetical protein